MLFYACSSTAFCLERCASCDKHCLQLCPQLQVPYLQNPENGLFGLYSLVLGAFGFPLGLFLICVVGADLFTSNCAYMLVALHEGRTNLLHLIRVSPPPVTAGLISMHIHSLATYAI
jgi:hypothetical protein